MRANLLTIVKSSGKITSVTIIFAAIICMAHFRPAVKSVREQTDAYFQKEIQFLTDQLTRFQNLCRKKASLKILQAQFITSRYAYKKLAVLSEYFNTYETKFLNGPALNRIEEGAPDVIIPASGFQAIEEILFSNQGPAFHVQVSRLLEDMLGVLNRMQREPDRIYKFKDESVWDAMRSATVRLTSLGITGYDSPISQNSLAEARSSITGIKNILAFFKKDIDSKKPGSTASLLALLMKADIYLQKNNDFNGFDGLLFISSCINPFYEQLITTRLAVGIAVPAGQSPVNFNTVSIFEQDFFNINFFSPDKEFWKTEKRVALGKKLFSDPILAGAKDRSCAGCHLPEKAFTDGLTVPYALDNKTLLSRNTPTLWNSALQTRQFLDARTDILENQLTEVVHNTAEMKGSLKEAVVDLKQIPGYASFFADAYSGEKEPLNAFNIANAISCYIRSLIALRSPFDEYLTGNKSKMTASAKKGFNLFAGKAKCATCHFIPLFNGLVPPEFTETETEVLGVPATKSKTEARLDNDLGKFNISHSLIHQYAFKTPGLRNIELTAPYMHNGVFSTLEEVMDFYNEGGGAGLKIAPDNQTLPNNKLLLTKKEIADIISFMKTLTDPAVKDYK